MVYSDIQLIKKSCFGNCNWSLVIGHWGLLNNVMIYLIDRQTIASQFPKPKATFICSAIYQDYKKCGAV